MEITDQIKAEIEISVCPVHDIRPVVEKSWDGISIICCCSAFHTNCVEQANVLLRKMKAAHLNVT